MPLFTKSSLAPRESKIFFLHVYSATRLDYIFFRLRKRLLGGSLGCVVVMETWFSHFLRHENQGGESLRYEYRMEETMVYGVEKSFLLWIWLKLVTNSQQSLETTLQPSRSFSNSTSPVVQGLHWGRTQDQTRETPGQFTTMSPKMPCATGAASRLSIFFEPQVLWRKVSTEEARKARQGERRGISQHLRIHINLWIQRARKGVRKSCFPIYEKKLYPTTCARPKERERGRAVSMVLWDGFREVCGLVCEDVELVLTSTYACLNHSFDWGEQALILYYTPVRVSAYHWIHSMDGVRAHTFLHPRPTLWNNHFSSNFDHGRFQLAEIRFCLVRQY